MKKLLPAVAGSLLLLSTTALAQSMLPTTSLPTVSSNGDNAANKKKVNTENIPVWLRELSNLSADQRTEYTSAFAQAKAAYAAARLAECESHLNTCEFIYQGNPNVWSLRASLLIAQRRFDEAEPLLAKVLREQPDDQITIFNQSLLSLGKGDYARCAEQTEKLLEEVRYTESMQLQHSLKFRLLLSYLMLGKEAEARKLVEKVTPLDDSPLYYYSQAAFSIYQGNASQAARDIVSADRIYAREKYLLSYKQNLSFSKLQEKYLPH